MDIPGSAQVKHRNLAEFSGRGYDKGRGILTQILWMAASGPISRWWCPVAVRVRVLRLFGANIGEDVIIRHRVRIHWPWKLQLGDRSWVGEGAWILNLEPVTMGADVCVSQDVLLCTGSHDRHSPTFEFDNAPITVRDGAWIAVRATVLRGVTVGRSSVVGATALVVSDVADGQIVRAPVAHP